MILLNQLTKCYKVDAKQPPSTEEEIYRLMNFSSIKIPEDYLEIIKQATEVEINVENQKYIRIWGAKGCLEMNKAYNIQQYVPNSLAIGDDEGGSALIYLNGNEGFGLYIVGFGDLDIEDAIKISPGLLDLLTKNTGLETLKEY